MDPSDVDDVDVGERKSFVLGVAGGSGSGKSTVIHEICSKLDPSEYLVLNLDNYYSDLAHLSHDIRASVNFDRPDAIDHERLREDVLALLRGEAIERPTYDFKTHTRVGSQRVEPKPIIMVDGIFSLYFHKLYSLFDLRVFIDVADDIRFIRRLKRDIAERGREMNGVIEQYVTTVRPMHIKYVQPTKHNADLVVFWERYNLQAIDMIAMLLAAKAPIAQRSLLN